MTARRRPILFALAAAGGALLLAEGALRLALGPAERDDEAACARWPYTLGMCLKPGTEAAEEVRLGDESRALYRAPFRVNAHGLRGPEFDWAKPAGVRRFLALGDSTAFGWGVAEGETYPDLLRGLLAETPKAGPWEVLNGGAPGFTSAQVLHSWRERFAPLAPDAVLLSVCHNDGSPYRFEASGLGLPLTDEALIARYRARALSPAVGWLRERALYRALALALVPLRKAAGGAPPNRVPLPDYGANLRALADEIGGAGARLFFLAAGCDASDPYGAVFREVAEARGTYFDAIAACRAREEALATSEPYASLLTSYRRDFGFDLYPGNRDYLCTLDGSHLDRLGHYLLAERLRDWIREGFGGR